MALITRRLLLRGLVAAPAIVAADNIMPVRPWEPDCFELITGAPFPDVTGRYSVALAEDGTVAAWYWHDRDRRGWRRLHADRLDIVSPRETWGLDEALSANRESRLPYIV